MRKKTILRTLSNHQDISKLPALGHFYLALTKGLITTKSPLYEVKLQAGEFLWMLKTHY